MPERGKSPHWAWFDGRLVPFAEARIPIEDRGVQFGESLYELVAVVEGAPFHLEAHVERMAAAAAELGMADGVPQPEQWERIIGLLHEKQPEHAALLYAQVTGGAAPRNHIPLEPPRPLFFTYMRQHGFPGPTEVARGIGAVTVPDSRWQRSDLKTPMCLPAVFARKEAARRGADEAIFIGKEGYVSDGAASSVFVVRQRTVLTSPPTRRTLHSTSAEVVREICREVGISFTERYLTLSDLRGADELFIASTSQLLMPVVRVDSGTVGGGTPGPITLQLAYHFQRVFWGASGP